MMSHKALISYCLIMMVFAGVLKIAPIVLPDVLGYAVNITMVDLLKHTNEQRAKVGLKPLVLNTVLNTAAEKKARDMFKVGYWAHVSPLGTKPWDFILSEGYDYLYAGENLAKNFSYSKDVVEAWYNSPTHRENLLSANYDDIGFAIVNGTLDGHQTTIVVQMFGRPRTPSYLASAKKQEKSEVVIESPLTPPTDTLAGIEEEAGESVPMGAGFDQVVTSGEVKPMLDVRLAANMVVSAFGLYLIGLLGLDIWYSRRHGIAKITGHTLAHIGFLLVVLACVLFTLYPGVVL